jgi:hypothetical protein
MATYIPAYIIIILPSYCCLGAAAEVALWPFTQSLLTTKHNVEPSSWIVDWQARVGKAGPA